MMFAPGHPFLIVLSPGCTSQAHTEVSQTTAAPLADNTQAQLLGSGKATCRYSAFLPRSPTLTPS